MIKESCKHPGGILSADDCVRNFIGKKNEAKVFVGTNDEDLRNDLRNLGTVPIFFFKHSMLVMDAPTEVTEEKHRMVKLVLLLTFVIERATEDRADEAGEGVLEGTKGADRGVSETGKAQGGDEEEGASQGAILHGHQ